MKKIAGILLTFFVTLVRLQAQCETPPDAAALNIIQPTCAVQSGTITIISPLGEYEYNIDGGIYQSGVTFSNVAPGNHQILVRRSSDFTCISNPSSATILSIPAPPSIPYAGEIIQPTCGSPSGTIAFVPQPDVEYSVGSAFQSNPIFSGLPPSTYTLTVRSTSDNTCITAATATVTLITPVTPSVPAVASVTQPTCSDPAGTIVFATQSGVEYSVGSGYQSSPIFSGLSPATYTLTVRSISDITCITPAASVITLNTPVLPAVPTAASVTQPTCATNTGTIVFSEQSGVEYSVGAGYQSSPVFSGLLPGNYTLSVRNILDNTCVRYSSSSITLSSPVPPAVPAISAITQPSCSVPAGTIVFNTQSDVEYSVGYGYQTSPAFSGLVPQTYTLTVRSIYDNSCITAAASTVTINAQPPTPAAPIIGSITQPTCGVATGSIPVSGLPVSGTWTLTRAPDNIATSGTGTTATIPSISPGTYTFTVTNSSGCTSVPSLAAVINDQPITPSAPVVGNAVQPTCTVPTGSVQLSGLPSSGSWTVTRTPGNVTSSGSGTTTTISGIPSGTYTFTVTNSSGCTSLSSGSVTINSQPPTPSAPAVGTITQPTCSVPSGSVPLSGLPSSGTWTVTMSPGSVTVSGSGSTTTITGVPAGSYTFTVTNSAGCTSAPSSAAILNSQPLTPSVPVAGAVVQPSCTIATGSVTLSGLPSSGTWTLTRSPGGVTTTGSGTTAVITGLTAGTYTYTVTNSSGCTSTSTSGITIYPQPATPSAPVTGTITQPTCMMATGSVSITGLPASGTWTVTRMPGAVTTTGTGTASTISGIAAGNYTFTVTNESGCISAASTGVTINEQPVTPEAPVAGNIIQPSCTVSTGTITLNGLPSSGTWTLTRAPGNISTTGTGISTSIAGLQAGTYTYTITNTSGCTSIPSAGITVNPQPVTPSAPVPGIVSQPTCTAATGSIQLTGLPSSGTWTLTRVPGNVTTTGSGTGITIAGLVAGVYSFTVTNPSGCTSASSPDITVNTQPVTPSAPVIGTITQPSCTVATGAVALSGLPATGNWTITRTPGGVATSGSGTSLSVSGLPAGIFSFTVTNTFGCTSPASQNVAINTQPPTPSAPLPGTVIQPSPDHPAGSIVLNGLPSSGTWTVHRQPGGINTSGTGTSATISEIDPGSYTFTVTNSSGCTSAPTNAIGLYLLKLYGPDNKVIRSNDTIKITSPEPGSFTFRVESNSDWKVTDNALWFKAVKESPASIKVTYSENISVKDKTSSLTVTYTSNPEITINVRQQGRISQLKVSKLANARLYPNPAGDFLYLSHGNTDIEKTVVTIADIQGHVVMVRNYERLPAGEITEINVSRLPSGQFLFNITDGSDSRTFRFIKY